VANKTPEV